MLGYTKSWETFMDPEPQVFGLEFDLRYAISTIERIVYSIQVPDTTALLIQLTDASPTYRVAVIVYGNFRKFKQELERNPEPRTKKSRKKMQNTRPTIKATLIQPEPYHPRGR